jgi:hypothetical protein
MLSPYQRGATLTDEEAGRLHTAITGVLGDAVERLVPLSGNGLTTKADRGYAVHDRRASRARAAATRSGASPSRSTRSSTAPPAQTGAARSPTGVCHGSCGNRRARVPEMLERATTFTHDLQAAEPDVRLALTRAGVTGVEKVIRIAHAGTSSSTTPTSTATSTSTRIRRASTCRASPRRGRGDRHVVIDEALHVEDLAQHIAESIIERPAGGALRGDDPGQVPGDAPGARVRPADAGDLPPDRAGARRTARAPAGWSASRCAG